MQLQKSFFTILRLGLLFFLSDGSQLIRDVGAIFHKASRGHPEKKLPQCFVALNHRRYISEPHRAAHSSRTFADVHKG